MNEYIAELLHEKITEKCLNEINKCINIDNKMNAWINNKMNAWIDKKMNAWINNKMNAWIDNKMNA